MRRKRKTYDNFEATAEEREVLARRGLQIAAFGKMLATARKSAKLTQKQLGVKAGLSTAAIHQLETGRSSTTLLTLLDLADALDTGPDLLVASMAKFQNSFKQGLHIANGIEQLSKTLRTWVMKAAPERAPAVEAELAAARHHLNTIEKENDCANTNSNTDSDPANDGGLTQAATADADEFSPASITAGRVLETEDCPTVEARPADCELADLRGAGSGEDIPGPNGTDAPAVSVVGPQRVEVDSAGEPDAREDHGGQPLGNGYLAEG